MSIKLLRERLCAIQPLLHDAPEDVRSAVNGLVSLVDRHRPLGTDGKHGDLHTPTCGCDDRPTEVVDLVAALRASVDAARKRREAAARGEQP